MSAAFLNTVVSEDAGAPASRGPIHGQNFSHLPPFIMPIVDIELVCGNDQETPRVSASSIASVLGAVFGTPPGHTWVRVRVLPSSAYAENDQAVGSEQLPVFITILQAHWPTGDAMAEQVHQVTQAAASCLGIPLERVHVQYAPEAAGRQAFGGKIVN